MLAIVHATILTPHVIIRDGTLIASEGRIRLLGGPDLPLDSATEVRDATGLILAPGFIDLQVNGGFGLDFTDDPSSIWEVAGKLPRYGVTGFLPTIITSPPNVTQAAQEIIQAGAPSGWDGTRPLGLHLEGPFLNPAKKGAHNPGYLRLPNPTTTEGWSPTNGVQLVTMAPELPRAIEMIRELSSRGIVVSEGHSLATYDEAVAGFTAGARYATHLFNAMPPLNHREPNLPAAALVDPRVTVGLISDGLHVHPAMVNLVWQLLGRERLNLVTDAMAAMGMPPGEYLLGDYRVTVDDTSARLPDGTLAGCTLSLDAILRRFMNYTNASLGDALSTVTTTPARLLGLEGKLGDIAPGKAADLVLITPDVTIVETFIGGRSLFRA